MDDTQLDYLAAVLNVPNAASRLAELRSGVQGGDSQAGSSSAGAVDTLAPLISQVKVGPRADTRRHSTLLLWNPYHPHRPLHSLPPSCPLFRLMYTPLSLVNLWPIPPPPPPPGLSPRPSSLVVYCLCFCSRYLPPVLALAPAFTMNPPPPPHHHHWTGNASGLWGWLCGGSARGGQAPTRMHLPRVPFCSALTWICRSNACSTLCRPTAATLNAH